MRLAEARTLKPGDQVVVDDWLLQTTHEAIVVRVTPRGGVLVEVNGGIAWVPYSRVTWTDRLTRRMSATLFWK